MLAELWLGSTVPVDLTVASSVFEEEWRTSEMCGCEAGSVDCVSCV